MVKAENAELRARLLELEQLRPSISAAAAAVQGGSAPGSSARIARLQAEVRIAQQTVVDLQKRGTKMTEHFVSASRRYREAVSTILGWRYAVRP